MKPLFQRSDFHAVSCKLPAAVALAALLALASGPVSASAASDATPPAAGSAPAKAPARHPLKGVVLDIRADRSALIVKHEEIPGVMRAMTMLFKVDAATLQSARKGQGITGLMSRQGDVWVLEEVRLAAGKAP
jgi:Cu/Ag efflux protein CusF